MSASSTALRRPFARDLGATLAVAAFSVVVAAGFARVFTGWSFMDDLVVLVLVGHGLGFLLRRLALSSWLAVPATALGLVWAIAAIYYPETLSWGLPTGDTWELFRIELDDVRAQFRTAVAPVIYGGGWDVLAAIGLAIAVLLADVFAFRAYARAETLVPGGVLFVFVGALGDERLRVALTVVLVAVGVATISVLRSHFAADSRPATAPSLRRVWPAVVAVSLVVAVVAGFVGPRLPGADAAPIYETSGGGGGGVTEVVSPLVDIRSRLTNQSDNELFQVRASAESYWRSSALPEFDGTVWGLPERELQSAAGQLDEPARRGAVELRQEITVTALGGNFVPAAPDPVRASGPDDLRWVAETSTLVTVDDDLGAGDVIEVISASPRPERAALAATTSTNPGDPIYTELPSGLPSVVAETARRVTASATSSYEAALLLQAWFQREFTYSLEIQAGHGNNAIESFLRQRVGYCEQFAGTYAAMLRTLGIPARVAVGFTSGIETEPGVYSVRGRNAHAWPEVWFDGIGWVGFEPTPGRGAPGAEDYTGIPPAQDTTGAEDLDAAADETTRTTIAPTGADDAGALLIPNFGDTTTGGAAGTSVTPQESSGIDVWWLLAAAAVMVVAAAPMLARRIRSGRHGSVEQQLGHLWGRSVGALADAGVPVEASQTPLETAEATAKHFPVVARPVALLADAVTAATYRPEGGEGYDVVGVYGASTMRNCSNWSRQIDRAVYETAPIGVRLRRYVTDWG